MEFLNSIIGFLVDYQGGVNKGLFYGILGGMIAAATTVVIFSLRWFRLLALRKRDSNDEIRAGGLEGEASALFQITKELTEYADAGRKNETEPDSEDGESGKSPQS